MVNCNMLASVYVFNMCVAPHLLLLLPLLLNLRNNTDKHNGIRSTSGSSFLTQMRILWWLCRMSELFPESDPWVSLLSDSLTVWILDWYHPMIDGLFSYESMLVHYYGDELYVWFVELDDRIWYAIDCENSWGPDRAMPQAMPLQDASEARADAALVLCSAFKAVGARCATDVLLEILRFGFPLPTL